MAKDHLATPRRRPSSHTPVQPVSSNASRAMRCIGERGSILIETVLVMPILAVILVGLTSTGLVIAEQFALETGARDAARSGAVMPFDAPPAGTTWTAAVEAIARSHARDGLVAGAVCVALVDGATGKPVVASLTTRQDGAACFAAPASGDLTVQVEVTRPAQIEAVMFTLHIDLLVQTSARYELPRPL